MPFDVDEANPADDAIVSQFPANERSSRTDIKGMFDVDHTEADGKHSKVTLPETTDPTAVANTGFLYTKDDTADTELFYRDDSGNIVQMTRDGEVAGFSPTTSMLFYQSAAPIGWTKDTTTLNNHALRVVSSTAWSAGSKGATAFDSVFGSGKTAGSHVLTIAEMPAHTHTIDTDATDGTVNMAEQSAGVLDSLDTTSSTGGGGSHNHTLSLDLNYINVIRATKD